MRVRRVMKRLGASMALCWASAAFIDSEQHFRHASGYKDLWRLVAALGR